MAHVGVGALACAYAYVGQMSTLDILFYHSPPYLFRRFFICLYVYVFVIWYVCVTSVTWRTEEGCGSPGAGCLSSFELPNVGTGNQTQFLWKKESSHPLRSWTRLPHYILRQGISLNPEFVIFQLAPGSVSAPPMLGLHMQASMPGFSVVLEVCSQVSCLYSYTLATDPPLASHSYLLLCNLKSSRLLRAKKYPAFCL